ncbi:MAG: cell division protein FtsQ/DivIB [Brachymonas sp.]|nr:cell division protein FtsQ/DivIB [Brachymonas sp.]
MAEQTAPTPAFISTRLMAGTATALMALAAVLVVAALFWRALHAPVFAIDHIAVVGETSHSSETALRREVLPQLRGNFFTLPLQQVREAFHSQPWVRQTVVRRVFPNKLVVQVQEHEEAAFWGNEEDGYRLLSKDGIVFDANPDEALRENLPELSGPDAEAPQVLAAWRLLNPEFAPLHSRVVRLGLDARGSWQLQLEQDTQLVLGQGAPVDLLRRTQQFVQTVGPIVARYNRSLDDIQYADLRYPSGYALRIKGVGTVDNAPSKNTPPPKPAAPRNKR